MLRSRDYYKLSWDKYKKEKDVVWGAEAGILLQFLDDSLIIDNSLTYAFNRKRSYLTLG